MFNMFERLFMIPETILNLKIVYYIDVTFNLNDGIYKQYTKPNSDEIQTQ